MRGHSYRFIQEITESFREPILAAQDRQLRQAIKATKKMSSTNCGWQNYWCKDLIARFCAEELDNRKRQRRMERANARKAARNG